MTALVSYDRYFVQRMDLPGRKVLMGNQKETSTLLIRAYGACEDAIDETLNISQANTMEAVIRFCTAVLHCFGKKYMC